MRQSTSTITSMSWLVLALASLSVVPVNAFSILPQKSVHTRLFSSATDKEESTATTFLSLNLEKPLGMILEEVEEGAAKGAFVLELAEGGSAMECPQAKDVIGATLMKVMGEDVTCLNFDDVMDKLIEAPSPVALELVLKEKSDEPEDPFPVGTPVAVIVQREGEADLTIDTKVGENLRQTLLDHQVEVYRGFKAKIGNCGGGGQCGFCAVEFVESEGWEPRSDYEDKKLKKQSPNARLSCLNNIQGPVTIKM